MIITEKMNELLKENDIKIKEIENQRNNEIYNNLIKINNEYEIKIMELKNKRKEIETLTYLDYENSINVLNYLVSNIEEEKYEVVTIPIRYKAKRLQKDDESTTIYDYFVTGLSKDKENVEIKNNGIYTERNLNIPFVNFVKLAHFNNKNIADLKVNYLNDTYNEYYDNSCVNSNIDSVISDHRFLYIKDYIKRVIDYRLNKDNFEITLDEMLLIADEFVNEYKNPKKLVKDIK